MVNAVFRYCWFVGLCQSYMSIVLFDSEFVQYKPCRIRMECSIHPVFLIIPMYPWVVESSWIFFWVVGRHFRCCVWPEFCWFGHMLFECKVCMQPMWVYHWYWWSVLPVPWLVVSVEGCIRCPWRRWWEIPVLGWRNPRHRELWLCVSGKRGLIVSRMVVRIPV